jgi:hypothetical protein
VALLGYVAGESHLAAFWPSAATACCSAAATRVRVRCRATSSGGASPASVTVPGKGQRLGQGVDVGERSGRGGRGGLLSVLFLVGGGGA